MNRKKIIFTTFAFLFLILGLISIILIFFYIKKPEFVLAFVAAGWFLSIIIAFIVLYSDRPQHSKAAWLTTLIIMPHIGFILFIAIGIRPIKYIKKKQEINVDKNKKDLGEFDTFFSYGQNCQNSFITKNNDIEVLENNNQLFEQSIQMIKSAKTFINIISYRFSAKGFWIRILFSELIKKAQEGVKIKLVYDWVGVRKRISRKCFKLLDKYGIDHAIFNPKYLIKFNGNANHRNHCKIMVVDNKISLFGGSNFADEYLSMAFDEGNWCDSNIVIKGEIVPKMNEIFNNYWKNLCIQKTDKKHYKQNALNDQPSIYANMNYPVVNKNTKMQITVYQPDYNVFALETFMLNLINNTCYNLKICTPYFCLSPVLIKAFKLANYRGVKIEIYIGNKNQHYVQLMNRFEIYGLLNYKNIKIYEYDGFLHAKYFIIDNKIVSMGSCNLDYRSLYLNWESQMLIVDKNLTKSMNKHCDLVKHSSTLITEKIAKEKIRFWQIVACNILNFGKIAF